MSQLVENRRFRIIIALISLIFLIDMIQDTYAKYVSSADAVKNFTIARWSFLVNNQDVLSNNNFSNTITPVIDANANIASGVIAPTSTGYFDIVIDSTNVDVAFNETITLSQGDNNTVSDLVFTGYKKNNDSIVSFTNSTVITNVHPTNEQNRTNTYRFYIEWKDGTGETLDNYDDADESRNGIASVKVNISFVQIASNPPASSSSNENPEPDPSPSSSSE